MDRWRGSSTTITICVWGRTRYLPVTIVVMQQDKTAKADYKKPPVPKQRATNVLGLAVSDIPADQLKALKLHNGVQVDAADGPAARVGLQKGDIILRVGDTDVSSAKQFDELTSHLDSTKMVALLVRRGENTQFVPVRPRSMQK